MIILTNVTQPLDSRHVDLHSSDPQGRGAVLLTDPHPGSAEGPDAHGGWDHLELVSFLERQGRWRDGRAISGSLDPECALNQFPGPKVLPLLANMSWNESHFSPGPATLMPTPGIPPPALLHREVTCNRAEAIKTSSPEPHSTDL